MMVFFQRGWEKLGKNFLKREIPTLSICQTLVILHLKRALNIHFLDLSAQIKKTSEIASIIYLTKLPQEKPDAQAILTFSLLAAQTSNFLIHPFLNTVSQVNFGYLPFTVKHLHDLRNTMQLHWSPIVSHSTFNQGSRGFSQGWQAY